MHLKGKGISCDRGERQLFTGVDFSLAPGELLLLRGSNGSGKSSFLRLIAGLLRPAAGAIYVDDTIITPDWRDLSSKLIYVGHQDPVKPAFSVAENLIFWMGLMGLELQYKRGRGGGLVTRGSEDALASLGLAELADVPARFLSSGQKRRLNLARLAAVPRALWLLDEPTVGLDQASCDLLAALIDRHRAGGGLVIAACHGDLGAPATSLLDFDLENRP